LINETIDKATMLQGARDWAHSVQKRQAETLMAAVAREAGTSEMDLAYRQRLVDVARAAGVDEAISAKLAERAKLEKVSEFDEPDVRHVSDELVAVLTRTMAEAKMSTGGRELLVSSLASGQVNALCATNSWDDSYYHIFVDADLTVFCNSIAKLVAECLVRDNMATGEVGLDPEQIADNVMADDIQKRAADLFCSTVLRGTPRASEPWPPSPEALGLTVLLSNTLNMFPIAHELGHLHLGHLASEETRHAPVEGLEVDAAIYSRDDEFAADAVGATVTNQTTIRLGASNVYTFLSPYIFLKCVEILDACFAVYDGMAGAMSFTHPSAAERATRIREVLFMLARYHNSGKLLPQALRAVDIICQGMELVAVRNLKRLKSEGYQQRERIRLTMTEMGGPRILGLFGSRH
jgi:hypothetical protein